MMIYKIAEVLTGIVESIMIFILYETFLIKRTNLPKWVYYIGIVVLAGIINISNLLFNFETVNVIIVLLSFFAASVLYIGKVSIKIIISVFGLLLISIAEVLILFAVTLIYDVSVSEVITIPAYRLAGIVVSKMTALIFVNSIRLKLMTSSLYTGTSFWILFLIMFVSSTATVFLIFKMSFYINNESIYKLSVFCSFGLLFITFFAFYLFEHLAKQTETIRKQQQYEQNLKLQLNHLDEILIAQNQIKKFMHDFSNYAIGLQSYIDKQDCDGASAYMKNLTQLYNINKSIIETGNAAFDAIINTKNAIANSKNIEFSVNIQIPEKIAIDPIDICVIFGNALDNAIEACERLNDVNKKISLTVIYQNKSLFCRIVNTSPKSDKQDFKTSKQDKKNHGFGLENIKTALYKYNSTPTILHTDNEFTLKFVIFLKE